MIDLKLDIKDGVITCIHDFEEVNGEYKKIEGRFVLPADITLIDPEALVEFDPLAIEVEDGNSAFYAKNNCLITKETGELAMGCSNSIIPDDGSITAISANAFNTAYDLSKMNLNPLRIPNSVKWIGYRAFAITSENPIHIIIPKEVEDLSLMSLMAKSDKGPVMVTFEGSPEMEPGVFGTKGESADSEYNFYKELPDLIYTKTDDIKVYCHQGTTVESYCKKYLIPFELI